MRFSDIVLLQEPAPEGGGWQMLVMFGAIIVVFYFFMIRPQQKRQKQEAQFRSSLEKGDRVTTIGGIYGRIVSVEDATALVEIDNGVKIKMEKAALKPIVEAAPDKK
jgi:preprotein translocase subunit YajC